MLRLIGLTIKGIILLALFIGGAQFITLSDETWTSISTWATMENMHIVVGGLTVIIGLALVMKVGTVVAPVVKGTCKVVFLPVTLPLKVLGSIASIGRSSDGYSGGAGYAPAPTVKEKPERKSSVRITKHEPQSLKPVKTAKTQHGYKLTYQNITAKKGNTQTVRFLFRGGPTECALALENGELSGQGFVPSCCQIVSLEMTH